MRNRFDEQLALLNVELIKMGSLCELAIDVYKRQAFYSGLTVAPGEDVSLRK